MLRVKVICGQHLPKSDQKLKGDVIEPYVKVRLRGRQDDDDEYVTKVVPKNGLNPTWNETAVFRVSRPDFAFLEFRVKTRQSGQSDGEHLGSSVVHLDLIREGYRQVYLESYSGKRLTPASLLVNISLTSSTSDSNS